MTKTHFKIRDNLDGSFIGASGSGPPEKLLYRWTTPERAWEFASREDAQKAIEILSTVLITCSHTPDFSIIETDGTVRRQVPLYKEPKW